MQQNEKETSKAMKQQNAVPSQLITSEDPPEPKSKQSQYPYRKNLSMKVKHLLSPHAKIKDHRRANYLYRHSRDKIDTNLLIFLHGAGDSHVPYHELFKTMNIPQCAGISLHASCMGGDAFERLPFDLGHSWFTEMDYNTGLPLDQKDPKSLSSLQRGVHHINRLLSELTGDDGWLPERIFLFGFSAGACLAMETCVERVRGNRLPLGGAICVAGGAKGISQSKSSEPRLSTHTASPTPLLIMAGSHDEKFSPSVAKDIKDMYNITYSNADVSVSSSMKEQNRPANVFVAKEKRVHGMINSEEETKAVMEFCAEHMVRRMTAMEGCCELSPGVFGT